MTGLSASRVWPVVHAERGALIQDLEGLHPSHWSIRSLCPGWDVHDVVAHLVDSAGTTRLGFIRRLVAAGFDFDRDNMVGIAREKATDPLQTLDRLKVVRTNRCTPPAALTTRLVEAFVHGEDIRRPLGIDRDYPAGAVAAALLHQVKTSVNMGGGKERAEGWHLVASDVGISLGSGPEIRGTAIALLLAVSGRPVTVAELTGPGVSAFIASLRDPA